MRRAVVLVEVLFRGGRELELWRQKDQLVNQKNRNNDILNQPGLLTAEDCMRYST